MAAGPAAGQSTQAAIIGVVTDTSGAILPGVAESGGAIVWKHSDERSSTDMAASGSYAHIARIPMTGLEPGRHVLTVEARSRLGHVASRQVPFEVAERMP